MLFKLALRNIFGNGWRSLINMIIIAIMVIGMIWMEAMYYSWIALAKTQQKEWEYAAGMFRVESYDPFDAFSWKESQAPISPELMQAINEGKAVPTLLSPAVIYPRQSMLPTLVKGIPAGQNLLKFPSGKLAGEAEGYVPAIVGTAMAKSTQLEEGEVFTLRVKDSQGAFNTLDLKLVEIMQTPVPTLDIGTVWIDLQRLQELKLQPDMASTVVFNDPVLARLSVPGFKYISEKEFFSWLGEIMKTENMSKYMIYGLLMFLAMLAIFDAQALAVFKRRKEIGTLAALGMTKGRIIRLFTLEGTFYSLFGIVLGLILGFPLFRYFAVKGYVLPEGYDDFGIAGFSEPVIYQYPIEIFINVIGWIMLITIIVSWFAARRISSLSPVDALRGK